MFIKTTSKGDSRQILKYSMIKKILLIPFLFLFSGCVHQVSAPLIPEMDIPSSTQKLSPVVQEEKLETLVGNIFYLPVLLYHHIGDPPEGASEDTKAWYVSSENFEAALQFIDESGYHPIFFGQLLEYLEMGVLPENSVVISFDDGAIDFYENAFPLLQKYHIKSVMHVQSHVRSKHWLADDHILELFDSGLVEFGSHTKYHAYLTRISEQEAREELQESKEKIEKLLGKEVYSIAYPFGLYNENIGKIAHDVGYKIGLTLVSGGDQDKEKLLEMKRIVVTNKSDMKKILSK